MTAFLAALAELIIYGWALTYTWSWVSEYARHRKDIREFRQEVEKL